MPARFLLSAFISFFLLIGETHTQCTDPSPSGDCDQDGIINGLDSDADNDGILDLFECQDRVEESFESSNGISTTFVFPAATTGIFIDLYALDNSFKININGTDLVDDELQFQIGPSTPADSDLIYASDGTRFGRNGNPQIWNINGGPGDPIVRLKMSPDGQVLILGKRFTNSILEQLIVQPGDPQFNNITWNQNATNMVTISQEVVGPTYINGQIFGLDCNNDTDGDGTPDYLDLNSDDDLCPDAIEGDENLMNEDLLDNTAIDSGVDECGIPLVLGPRGQGVGTSIDPTLMSSACLSFTIAPSSPSCIGNNDGAAIINVMNGLSNYLYELNPGQITQSTNEFNELAAGDYTVIVTDPNSNFETTLFFTIDPSPYDCLTCQARSTMFDCASNTRGSIDVTPSGGISPYCFSINGAQVQKDGLFENLTEGIYTFEILDRSGQAVTCNQVVDLIELPVVEYMENICFGDSVMIGNRVYTESGMYADTLESVAGCDSIVNLDLQISDLIQFDQMVSLCSGDALTVGANNYTLPGNYVDTLQSVTGCDSIVTSRLNIFDSFDINQAVSICNGDTFRIAESIYILPGSYTDTLINANGCDSIVNTELQYFDVPETNQEIFICEGDSLSVESSIYFLPGNYTDTLINANGCDSIVLTELEYFPMPGSNQAFSICDGDSIEVAGSVYYFSGNYTDTLQNLDGCDSIILTELNILNHTEYFQSMSLCNGDSLAVGTSTYTISGDYLDTLRNAQGCDSLIHTNLEFLDEIAITQEAEICPGEFIEVGLSTYTISGTYIDTLISRRGCDSIVNTIVMDLAPSEFFQAIDLCSGETLLVGSRIYDSSGIFMDTLENSVGCDSIIQTELFVRDEIVFSQSLERCANDFILVGNTVYDEAGIYLDTLLSRDGCDSLVSTNLSFLDIEQISESYKLCAGDSIEHDLGVFVEPGIFTFLIEEEGDCDFEFIVNIESEDEEICRFENCKAFIPNVFSPGNDSMNEMFQPFSEAVTFTQMMIYDRWGNKIFQSEDSNPSWNGTLNGRLLAPGVFVYVIEGFCKNGEEILFADDVTLIR